MRNNQISKNGLSEGNQNFIVILVLVFLLVFGPIEPFGLAIRFAYLIIIPILALLVLRHLGQKCNMDKLSNDRLNRALLSGIAGALLVGAYLSYTASSHTECDQYVQTREGEECVGDYITVKGPDKGSALIQILFAGIAIWYAVAKRPERD
ncbi:MAG: hypothetical protein ACSLEX_03060 [Minisyncoccota bacterium]